VSGGVNNRNQPKIADFNNVFLREHSVTACKIHVDKALRGNVCTARSKLLGEEQHLPQFQRNRFFFTAQQGSAKIAIEHELKHTEPRLLLDGNTDHAHDVGMLQLQHDLCFVDEGILVRGCSTVPEQLHSTRTHGATIISASRRNFLVGNIHATKLSSTDTLDCREIRAVDLAREESGRGGLAGGVGDSEGIHGLGASFFFSLLLHGRCDGACDFLPSSRVDVKQEAVHAGKSSVDSNIGKQLLSGILFYDMKSNCLDEILL